MSIYKKLVEKDALDYQKWVADTKNKDGSLRENLYYGESRLKVSSSSDLFVWAQFFKGSIADIVSIVDNLNYGRKTLYISDQLSIPNNTRSVKVIQERKKALEHLASAKVIICLGLLPDFFIKNNNQIVINLFDKQYYLNNHNQKDENAKGCISCFLKCDYIICRDKCDCSFLKNIIQLNGIYSGEIVVADKLPLHEIISNCLQGKKNKNQYSLLNEKKKLLILFNGKKKTYNRYLNSLLHTIDYTHIDVTLMLFRRPKSDRKRNYVENFNSDVRLMYRVGTLACSKDEYIKTQMLLNKMYISDYDIEDHISEIKETTISDEARRIFGDTEFDDLLYLADDKKMWKMISKYIKAEHKLILVNSKFLKDISDEDTELKNKMDKKIYVDNMVFDTHLVSSRIAITEAKKRLPFKNVKSWEIPYLMISNPADKSSSIGNDKKILRDESYYFLRSIWLFKEPQSNRKNIIVDINVEHWVDMIYASSCIDNIDYDIYLFGNLQNMDEPAFSQKENIKLVDRSYFYGEDFSAFLRSMDACFIADSKDTSNTLLNASYLAGLDCFTFEEGIIRKVELPLDYNLGMYEQYIRNRIDYLFSF